MTRTKDMTFFENKLLDFIKGVHSSERKTYRCGNGYAVLILDWAPYICFSKNFGKADI